MPEYDHQPPPPQYNPQAQYGRMPATQGYMSQQPPSYGAQPAQGKQSHIFQLINGTILAVPIRCELWIAQTSHS